MRPSIGALSLAAVLLAAAIATGRHSWALALYGLAAFVFVLTVVEPLVTRPRFVFGKPYVRTRHVDEQPRLTGASGGGTISLAAISVTGTETSASGGRSASFAYVPVMNRPRLGSKDAEHVSAELRFHGEDGTLLHEISGRWSATLQHGASELTLRPPEITMPRTRTERDAHPLDVAMKYPSERQCYAFNDENRFSAPGNLRHRPLGQPPIRVEITVAGTSARTLRGHFVLSHDANGAIHIERC